VLRAIQGRGLGTRVRGIEVYGASYADDCWIAASNWRDVETQLELVKQHLAWYGLQINENKSHCWSIPKWKGPEELGNFGDLFPMTARIPYETKFKSLGVTLEPWEVVDPMWRLAITKAKTVETIIKNSVKKCYMLPHIEVVRMST
jgi:hypothetical protein